MNKACAQNSQPDCWFLCISWELISQTLPASEIRQTNKNETCGVLHSATEESLSHSALTRLTLLSVFQWMYAHY